MKFKKNKLTNYKTLSRREALGIMGMSTAATGLSFLSFTTGLPAMVKADEIQGGKQAFSFVTKTKEGVVINAEAVPNHLSFSVTGNIQPEKVIPLVVIPTGENLTIDQIQQKEIALKLLAESGAFVIPRDIELRDMKYEGRIIVHFMFLGEEDPERRIEVIVRLKDASGNILNTLTRQSFDRRVYTKQKTIYLGRQFIPSIENIERLFVEDKEMFDRIAALDIDLVAI